MSFFKKFHWFELIVLVSILGFTLYAALSAEHNFPSRWFTRDDAYYYFKVAKNISEGHGSTFDGINLTNGYHPLWMLVCIPIFALARFDLILPLRVLMMVMAFISIATTIILFRMLRKSFSELIAIVISSFWAFSINVHSIITQQGMETGIVALSLVMLLSYIQKMEQDNSFIDGKAGFKQAAAFSALSLFVLLSRLDGIFIVLFAGVYVVLRKNHAFRTFLFIDVLLTYVVVVLAYVSRSDLPFYLAVYDSSALAFTVTVVAFQTVAAFYLGLYDPTRWNNPATILFRSFIAASISAGLASLGKVALSLLLPEYVLPRAIPFLYIVAVPIIGTFLRYTSTLLALEPIPSSAPISIFQVIAQQSSQLKNNLREWIEDAMKFGWISAAGLVLYMGVNRYLFGTFMPVSGQIKRWWGAAQNNVYGGPAQNIANMFGVDPLNPDGWFYISLPLYKTARSLGKWFRLEVPFINLYWVLFTIVIVGAVLLFLLSRRETGARMRSSGLFLLFISSFFHVFFYGATAYSAKHEWYWVPQMLTVVLFIGLLLQIVYDQIKKIGWLKTIASGLAAYYCVSMLYAFSYEMITRMPQIDTHVGEPFVDMLPIIEQHTEPGALIGMTGGGNIGYYVQDRTIMNMDGLINSNEYFQLLQENRGGEFYRKVGLDYIFASKFIITNSSPYRYQLTADELISIPEAEKYGHKEIMHYHPSE